VSTADQQSHAVSEQDAGRGPQSESRTSKSLSERIPTGNTMWIFLVLVGICVVFSVLNPTAFATAFEARTVATNASVLLVVAVGSTFVIITGGIDLSVGAVLVFSGVMAAEAMHAGSDRGINAGWGTVLWGLVVALASGLGWGLVNGILRAVAKIPALIATLGTLGAAYGFSQIITHGQDLRSVPDVLARDIGLGRTIGGVPWMVVIAAAVTLVGAFALNVTRFGRYTVAVGSNAEAARRAGINVTRHLIKVYAVQGLLAGLAGFLALAYFDTTTISGHSSDNLAAITAVVIGGTSLFGGRGTVIGTAIGVFIPAVLASGFVIVGVQSYWQNVALGMFLIVAVYVDQLRRQSRDRQ
jgi:ribose transport system permease protein